MNNKKHIVITLPYRAGGVSIIIRNILEYIDYSGLYFHVILIKKSNDKQAFSPDSFKANKITVFNYSLYDNKFSVFSRFCKLIPDDALIITNDYFELQALNTTKKTNKIIHVIHGSGKHEFEQIKKFSGLIDQIIGVSSYICITACKVLTGKNIPVIQINQPVPENKFQRTSNSNNKLKLLFVGRLQKEKGIFDLPIIDKLLLKNGVIVDWTIIGFGPDEKKLKRVWNNKNIKWTGKLNNKKVLSLYVEHDLIILPSHSEGLPLVIVEAMKAGVVPLVSDLPSGIPEIIQNGQNGYRLPVNAPDEYAEIIKELNNNKTLLTRISEDAIKSVNKNFNAEKQSNEYKKIIIKAFLSSPKKKKILNIKYGILDKPYIPNLLTRTIRRTLEIINT